MAQSHAITIPRYFFGPGFSQNEDVLIVGREG